MQGNGLSMDVGNPKKNEDLLCLQSGGKSKFGSLAMAFPLRISQTRILLSRKMCGSYQWEILVFFYFSRQTKSNLGKITSYTSHNLLHLTISLPLSLILRERGRHELPLFSPLFFCGYWQMRGVTRGRSTTVTIIRSWQFLTPITSMAEFTLRPLGDCTMQLGPLM